MQTTERVFSPDSPGKTGPEDYDVVILGGGTGSTVAAWTFAGEGKRVAGAWRRRRFVDCTKRGESDRRSTVWDPATGAEQARKVVDKTVPSNRLMPKF